VDRETIFRRIKAIGSGGFGTVYQIEHIPSRRVIAGKCMNSTLMDVELFVSYTLKLISIHNASFLRECGGISRGTAIRADAAKR
jgi:serine/threonine protein kinase